MNDVMTENRRSEDCCGCGACHALCTCIRMVEDEEGFPIPEVDTDCCVECGECLAVCPLRKSRVAAGASAPRAVYAAQRTDGDGILASTSGGMFTLLAEAVLDEGGVVFGARYGDDLRVHHAAARTREELAAFQRSKYVESDTEMTMGEAQDLLAQGRTVLYGATCCQIAGLKDLVGRHPNLITCDVLCHGVPSPELFRRYVQFEGEREGSPLVSIDFRDKGRGWIPSYRIIKRFASGKTVRERARYNWFMQPFLQNFSLRPVCYVCPFARIEREGDWTVGDYWGIEQSHPDIFDLHRGVSVVMVNTPKGEVWFDKLRDRITCCESTFEKAYAHHRAPTTPSKRPPGREQFSRDVQTMPMDQLARKYCEQPSALKKWAMRLLGQM
jgi:coenzyme F420-reducing hydrogenase beta subunit